MKLSRNLLATCLINSTFGKWTDCPEVDTSDWENIHPNGLNCSGDICRLRCASGYTPTSPLKAKCEKNNGEWAWNKTELGKCKTCSEPSESGDFVKIACKVNKKKLRICNFTCPDGMNFNGKEGKTGQKLTCKCGKKSGICKWKNDNNKKVTAAKYKAYKCVGDAPATSPFPTTKPNPVTPVVDPIDSTLPEPVTVPSNDNLPNYNLDNYNFKCSSNVCTLTLSDGQQFIGKRDGDIVKFRGIPYAKPPTGSRRFKAPKLITKYTAAVNAKKDGPACIQFPEGNFRESMEQSEDCLTINIMVPYEAIKNKQKVPIVAYIHGGNNQVGSNAGGFDALMESNIMSISINYRLGGFGFFHLKESEDSNGYRGNWGVQDQLAALKWISMYGGAFGGDHNSVCIDGCSAGSVNGWFHLTNPQSWPYFHRIVLTGIGVGGLAQYQGSQTDKIYDMVLQEANAASLSDLRLISTNKMKKHLVNASDKFLAQHRQSLINAKPSNSIPDELKFHVPREYVFSNIVGDSFLTDNTLYLVRKGQIRPNTPIAWSIAKDDAYMFAPAVYMLYAKTLIPKFTNAIMQAQEADGMIAPPSYQDKWFEVAYPNHADELKSVFGCKNSNSDCLDRFARWVQAQTFVCNTRWALSGAIKNDPAKYGPIYPQQWQEPDCHEINGVNTKSCHCGESPWIHGEMAESAFGRKVASTWSTFFKEGTFDSTLMKTWHEMNANEFNLIGGGKWETGAVKNWKECDALDKLHEESNHYSFGLTLNNPE